MINIPGLVYVYSEQVHCGNGFDSTVFWIVFSILVFASFFISILVFIMEIGPAKSAIISGIICGSICSIFMAAISAGIATGYTPLYETQHAFVITDQEKFDFTEFTSKYEIVTQKGNLLIVREKKD